MRLTVDLRMYRHSGIGRYLRNVFPLLLPDLAATDIRVLGNTNLLGQAEWLSDHRIELFETEAKIYSIQEQLLELRGAYQATDVLWVPHYNGPLLYRGKMLATIHDIAPIAIPQILDSSLKRAYANLLVRRTISQATALTCVSEFTSAEVKKHMQRLPKRISVIHPGVDADWPVTAMPHREADGSPYLLFVGNVKPNKNLGLLLRAFDLVKGVLPHRIILAGRMHGFSTGDERVLHQAKQLGDRVRFAGEVNDTELQGLYAGATALVVPSIYEGFGLILLEAMQLGCPVLASSAGSLPEVGGNAAMYFDPYDPGSLAQCLLKLQEDGVRERLSDVGHERVTQFSYVECAKQTASLLNELMQAVT